eukprot:gene11148-23307_t
MAFSATCCALVAQNLISPDLTKIKFYCIGKFKVSNIMPEFKMPVLSGTPDNSLSWSRPSYPLILTGKKFIFVGGTNGLGRALALLAAANGASCTVVGRTFRDADVPNMKFVKADLESMCEAKRVVSELPVETADAVVFSNGIMAAPQRQITKEGLERDNAVSYFSRAVMLKALIPRIGTGRSSTLPLPRVFIFGFPGVGEAGDLDDWQGEKKYSLWTVHMNSVAGNEALVLHHAKNTPKVQFFGLNPGLVVTDIRNNTLGDNSWTSWVVESITGWFTPTPHQYAKGILPLLIAPELEKRSGAMFGPKGEAILPSKVLTEQRVKQIIDIMEAAVTPVLTKGEKTK